MYELIILALLVRLPLHGYLISKITNDILGPYAKLSNGRLYPLLAQLADAGLLSVAEDSTHTGGGRHPRQYAITEAGRQRLHALLMDTSSNLGDYSRIFWYKTPHLYLLTREEQMRIVDHYITYCQTNIFHYLNEIEDLPAHKQHLTQPTDAYLASVVFVLEHVLRRWRLELESVQQWRARFLASDEASPEHPTESQVNRDTRTIPSEENHAS